MSDNDSVSAADTEQPVAIGNSPLPGYYFVAFVDLLGESKKLTAIARAPRTENEKLANLRAMKEAGESVRNIRNSFAEYFSMRTVDPHVLERHPPERREEFARIRSLKVFQIGFSDSFVIGIPLTPREGESEPVALACAVNDIANALLGLACLSLAALQQGIPLRAGIDVSLGMELFPNEVYGPSLLNAYHLESQVAEYPRAAIGETLLAYLSFLEGLPNGVILNQFTASMVQHCRKFVCPSPDDGWPMLHFLSALVMAAPGGFVKARQEAEAWVKEQVARYVAERNGKLFRRYTRLSRYFDAYKA
jgi:hypothetical protein